MKAIIIAACLFVFIIPLHSQNKGNDENATESDRLINEMTMFFTKTLENNYNCKNVKILYKEFLHDFIEKYNTHKNRPASKHLEPFSFNIKVNENRLDNINETLFQRDYLHYYYLYPEVIYSEQGEDIEHRFEKENSNIPYVLMQNRYTKSNTTALNFLESYNILLVIDDGFIKNIEGEGLNIVMQLKALQNNTGNIGLINVANILTEEENQEELNLTSAKQLVAVVFWKLLCLQKNIEFHKPPINP